MKIDDAFEAMSVRKANGRLGVFTDRGTTWVEIRQSHRNGSNEIVGELTLDDLSEVRDLHYELSRIIQDAESAV